MNSTIRALKTVVILATLALPLPAFAHGGTASRVPFEICDGQDLGESCQWDDGHGTLSIGTCRGVAPALRCIRNQPMVTVPSAVAAHDEHAHGGAHHTHIGFGAEHEQSTDHTLAWVMLALSAITAELALGWKLFGRRKEQSESGAERG